MPAWHAAIMSTVAAHVAQAALTSVSAPSSSPLVRGASIGSVQGFTVWHVFDIIAGAGESGTGLQADNVVRQTSISPGAKRGVFIGQSPVFKSNGVELRRDGGLRAVEPSLLSRALGGVLPQARNDAVARGERLLCIDALLSRRRQLGAQPVHVQRYGGAHGERDDSGGEFRGECVHAMDVVVASVGPAAACIDAAASDA